MKLPEAADLRAALTQLSNAKTDTERQAAHARAKTLGGQAILAIKDPVAREQFTESYGAAIEDATG